MISDSDDTLDVLEELGPIRRRASTIGTALGLSLDSFDSEPTLESVVSTWLKQDYNTVRHGEPNYRRLVKAVASTSGGHNPALPKKIAANHPASNLIYYPMCNSVEKSIHVLKTKKIIQKGILLMIQLQNKDGRKLQMKVSVLCGCKYNYG